MTCPPGEVGQEKPVSGGLSSWLSIVVTKASPPSFHSLARQFAHPFFFRSSPTTEILEQARPGIDNRISILTVPVFAFRLSITPCLISW